MSENNKLALMAMEESIDKFNDLPLIYHLGESLKMMKKHLMLV